MKTDIKSLLEVAGVPMDSPKVEELMEVFNAKEAGWLYDGPIGPGQHLPPHRRDKKQDAQTFYDGVNKAMIAFDEISPTIMTVQIAEIDRQRLEAAYYTLKKLQKEAGENQSHGKVE